MEDTPGTAADPGPMSTPARVAIAVFATAAVAFWIFAFSPWARDIFTAPDQLEDEAYVAAIEARCGSMRSEFDALPSPRSATTPEERAAAVVTSTGVLQRMVRDLAVIDGGTPDDRRLVGRWLDDWEIYLGDRSRHVERLLTEGDVRFLNTEANGIFIAERMDGFTRVNDLDSCTIPGDL